jgi:hypothetical protein
MIIFNKKQRFFPQVPGYFISEKYPVNCSLPIPRDFPNPNFHITNQCNPFIHPAGFRTQPDSVVIHDDYKDCPR